MYKLILVYLCAFADAVVCIQVVPGGMCKTSGECSLC